MNRILLEVLVSRRLYEYSMIIIIIITFIWRLLAAIFLLLLYFNI